MVNGDKTTSCNYLNPKFDLYWSYFDPKIRVKSNCHNEGSIINLVVMIVAFECGSGAKFNIKV